MDSSTTDQDTRAQMRGLHLAVFCLIKMLVKRNSNDNQEKPYGADHVIAHLHMHKLIGNWRWEVVKVSR